MTSDGGVVGTDLQVGGDCLDTEALKDDAPLSWHISSDRYDVVHRDRNVVSFIWGLVRSDVHSLAIDTKFGSRDVAFDGGRAFIVVVPGIAGAYPVSFHATMDDGTTRDVEPPPIADSIRQYMLNPPEGEELLNDIKRRSHPVVPGA